jgi:hypothetical protein
MDCRTVSQFNRTDFTDSSRRFMWQAIYLYLHHQAHSPEIRSLGMCPRNAESYANTLLAARSTFVKDDGILGLG